jgi:cysteine desulfurase family protein (TIGR01976 family)
MVMTSLSVFETVRSRFPALRQAGDREIFFDNAAGAQVPDEVVEAVRDHLVSRNVQRGGRYALSERVDRQIEETRGLLASFLNARSSDEIIFGLNSTTLIRGIAEALRPSIRPGDRVIVTELDHEANVGPWLRLETSGAEVVFWKVRGSGPRLDLEDLPGLLEGGTAGKRVRWIALPLASNATGSIVDVAAVTRAAREAGARVFVDAVHYAPHGPIDVQSLGADFLAFSGYKIFGPHVGFLWGRAEALRELAPAREFFIPVEAPYAFEAGTQVYEGLAGMAAAMRYLASLGDGDVRRAMKQIREAEGPLAVAFLEGAATIPGLTIVGDSSSEPLGRRVPTFAFRITGRDPRKIVEALAAHGIHARDGHLYAPRLMTALGIDPAVGTCRVSLCHYNTPGEIATFFNVLRTAGTG